MINMNKQVYLESIGIILLGVIISIIAHYTNIPSMSSGGDALMTIGVGYFAAIFRIGSLSSNNEMNRK